MNELKFQNIKLNEANQKLATEVQQLKKIKLTILNKSHYRELGRNNWCTAIAK